MPLSAKTMPNSVPGVNENLLGNQAEKRGGGGSVIYSPLPEALASTSWKETAVITSLLKYSCTGGDMKRLGTN